MPGQMPEQIAAQVARHCNEGVAGDPARNAPKEVIRRNQRRQEHETEPRVFGMGGKPTGERVDQDLHAVLGADRASDRRDDGRYNGRMGERPPPYVAGKKRKGTIAVPTVLHCGPGTFPASGTHALPSSCNAGTGPEVPREPGQMDAARNGGKLPEG